jgi:mono/diheme cytochrome c family protein
MRISLTLGCVALVAAIPALAGAQGGATKKPPAAAISPAATIAKGKTLVTTYHCNSCHAADLAGKKGFSPSLKSDGVLKEYNAKTWAVVLDTGVTNDGGMVKKPMPVYKMKAADSAAIWAYLKTVK